jgi:ethanolamine utilization microcompartment shell protein EutL
MLLEKIIRLAYYNPKHRYKLLPLILKHASEVPEWAEGKEFSHPDTGNKVKFQSLPSEEQTRLIEMQKQKGKGDEEGKDGKPDKFEYSMKDFAVDSAKVYAVRKVIQKSSKPIRAAMQDAIINLGDTKKLGATIDTAKKTFASEAFKKGSKGFRKGVVKKFSKDIAKRAADVSLRTGDHILKAGGATALAEHKAKDFSKKTVGKAFEKMGKAIFANPDTGLIPQTMAKSGNLAAKTAGLVVGAAVAYMVAKKVRKTVYQAERKIKDTADKKITESLKLKKAPKERFIKGSDNMDIGEFLDNMDDRKLDFMKDMSTEDGKFDQKAFSKFLEDMYDNMPKENDK